MTTELDCWGPYRSTIEERLVACEDYLGRLRRSFAGEIAPDRFYFGEKAHSLRDAAQALLDRVDDVEWWLGACAAPVAGAGRAGNSSEDAECGRSAGHAGPHEPEGRGQERRILTDARAVATELRELTDRLAWGLLTLRADAGVVDPRGVAGALRQLGTKLTRTASSLEAIGASPCHTGEHGS